MYQCSSFWLNGDSGRLSKLVWLESCNHCSFSTVSLFASNYFRFRTYRVSKFWNGHLFWSGCVVLTISTQLAQIIANSYCHKLLYLVINIALKQQASWSTYSVILLRRPRVTGGNGNWTACCVLRESGHGHGWLTCDTPYLQPDGKCCQTYLDDYSAANELWTYRLLVLEMNRLGFPFV